MIKYLSKTPRGKFAGVAILRLDFNTEDDWRLKAAMPTINFFLKYSRAVVILSHKGRPLGFQKEHSLRATSRALEIGLGREVAFFDNFNFVEMKKRISGSPAKSIFLLENLRFMPGESDNDPQFAKNIAYLGDFYVNEAFAVSHRKNASVQAIAGFLPSYAGLIFEKEITHLSRAMRSEKKPVVMILGGAKAHDKLAVIKYFKNKASAFLLGGALANTLLRLKGVDVDGSLLDREIDESVNKFLNYKNIVLPIDFRKEGDAIFDIGEKTEALFVSWIKKARTIIWNGPMGAIENEHFAKGTNALARAVAANKRAFSVVGGGETVMALKKLGLDKHISFISTGGGAMLDFLAGKKLPGIEALKKNGDK